MTTTREAALPLTDAPKDHTLLWLLVDYSGDGANPLEDEILGWTIGHNGFDHTGVDEWEFAGWSWEQDCFTQGVGNVVGWYPLQRPDQHSTTPATEPQGLAHIVDYTNWRGETARRVIRPVRMWWGKTEWHPEEQWMLTAWDCEKDDLRDFAWQDMRPVQNPATSAAARPAPQPAAEHEYPDPLIAEDRYEDDQPAVDTRVVTDAERDVIAERQRQRNVEGWTPEHDDEHDTGALAMAASCYATVAAWSDHSRMNEGIVGTPPFWPFEWQWWKPTDRRRDAVKACALLIAEIERLDRAIIGGQDRG